MGRIMIVTVPKTGAHPDLPSGISWSRVEDHGDTMTVRITVPTTQVEGQYRPDVPEGIIARDREYSADYQTVTVTLPDTPEVEQWAVEQGYHTPAQVTAGKFWVELYETDPALTEIVEALIDSDPKLRRAAKHEPTISRHGTSVLSVQAWCLANGYDHVTDEWLDALVRRAFLRQL